MLLFPEKPFMSMLLFRNKNHRRQLYRHREQEDNPGEMPAGQESFVFRLH
jgi:hypothetical protein